MAITFDELYAILEDCATTGEWRNKHYASYKHFFRNPDELTEVLKIFNISKGYDVAGKKKELLKLAYDGSPRPPWKSSLGCAFARYIKPGLNTYDQNFTKQIETVRPDWIFSLSNESTVTKKAKLIQMAKCHDNKPKANSKLGKALARYCNKNHRSYDNSFNAEIKKIRPDWFRR